MRPIALSTLFSTVFFMVACGPGESQKTAISQAQKAKNDSIRIAEIKATKDEQAYQASLRDSLTAYTVLLDRQQKALTQLQAAINAGNGQPPLAKTIELTNLRFAVQHSQDQIELLKRQLPR